MDPVAPPRRRWRSYSLRTLLVVTTLLCIALGWKMNRVRHVRNAVREVERLGGSVTFHHEIDPSRGSSVPTWLQQALGEHSFAKVFRIEIDDPRADDRTLALIAALPHIDAVAVRSNRVTDRGLARLAGAEGLRSIEIRSSQITPAGLAPLRDATGLIGVSLQDNPTVDDSWLAELATLTQVRVAILNRTNITDRGLDRLRELPALRSLEVAGTKLTPAGIAEFRRSVPYCDVAW